MAEAQQYNTSLDSYDNDEGAKNYLDFLESDDGQFFRKTLGDAFLARLGDDRNQKILDIACGPGWLTNEVSKTYPNIEGCDGSRLFLEHARKSYPTLKFGEADLNREIPYQNSEFDTLIFSMAAHDIENQTKTFAELYRILKPGGKLMVTIVNPYYSDPVGVWKRGAIGRLLQKMPRLLVRPYHWVASKASNAPHAVQHNKTLQRYIYTFSEQINNFANAGFIFNHMEELQSETDSEKFNLQYTIHRFPLIIYLEFKKPLQ